MSGSTAAFVQGQTNFGFGMVAAVLGNPCAWYRAASATTPTAAGNQLGTIAAAFSTTPDLSFTKPSQYGKPLWYGAFDPTNTEAGDYLIGPQGTFFIAAQQPFTAPICVLCNRTLTFARPHQLTGVGAQPYGGDITATETTLLASWPAAMTQGTKGERGDSQLPGDVRMPWVQILMPALFGIEICTSDVCYDDLGHKRVISSAEQTVLGWRLTASYAGT